MQKLLGLFILVAVFSAGTLLSDPVRGLFRLGMRQLPFSMALVAVPPPVRAVNDAKPDIRVGGLY